MAEKNERRRWPRVVNSEPGLGVIHCRNRDAENGDHPSWSNSPLYVGVRNHTLNGALIESDRGGLKAGDLLYFSRLDLVTTSWHSEPCRVIWQKEPEKGKFLAGLAVEPADPIAAQPGAIPAELSDALAKVESTLKTKLFRSIPPKAIWSLLNYLRPLIKEAGEMVMTQGEAGDTLFLIQQGECVLEVDKGGERLTVARLGPGDVVGEMAVLTGEPRSGSVRATKGTKLLALGKAEYEEVSSSYPELRIFLTELVSSRLENSCHTSERIIGKYLVKHKLGNGAWGIIYQGVHATLNKTVAIKMLKHTMAMDAAFQSRFTTEAKIIALLNHPNIVHVYDIESLYKTLFIVMEFLEGEPLDNILARQGAIPYPRTVNFLRQICAGLGYAHERGIVHQDIKPANLQVLPDDTIKILDFGLACDVGSEHIEMEGTAYYMAPEQINGEPVDGRTDIYCLGITAYEMVTGQRPYPEEDLRVLMKMHLEQDIPDPRLLAPDLPDELRRFITRACERDPTRRYQNMHEAGAELISCHREHSREQLDREKQLMSALFFFYRDEHVPSLNALLEEISSRAEKIGITIRASEYKGI